MSDFKTGWQPAFPVPSSPYQGLTKREYIAVMILNGLAAGVENKYQMPSVRDAVTLTDNLLAELEKTK